MTVVKIIFIHLNYLKLLNHKGVNINMTEEFNKFLKWSYLDHNCSRRIEPDAPKEIKIEAKKADEDYYKLIGRHMLKIDY